MLMWTLSAGKKKCQRLPLIETICALYWLDEIPSMGVAAFSNLFPLKANSTLLSQFFEALAWVSPYLTPMNKMTLLAIAHLQPALPTAINSCDTVAPRERRLSNASSHTAMMDINVFLGESLESLFG